jgi:hypothetical protein
MDSPSIRPAFRGSAAALGILLLVIAAIQFFGGSPFWAVVFPGLGAALIFLDFARRGK